MKDKALKLPNDVVGTIKALLQTPPMPRAGKASAKKPSTGKTKKTTKRR